jgi:hypothetical protein
MNLRFRGLWAVALVAGILIAGCGGGGGKTTTSSTTKTAAATHTAATQNASTSKTSSPTTASSPEVAAVVTRCKASISAVPTLSASEKHQLLLVCQRAASGNVAGATAAVRQVCVQIANHLPSGAARTEALTLCKASVAGGATGSTTGSTTPSIPTNEAGATAAVLKAACQDYSRFAKALPSNIANSIASVCQKVAQGDISGAKSELKSVCESVAKLLPASESSTVSANCNKL